MFSKNPNGACVIYSIANLFNDHSVIETNEVSDTGHTLTDAANMVYIHTLSEATIHTCFLMPKFKDAKKADFWNIYDFESLEKQIDSDLNLAFLVIVRGFRYSHCILAIYDIKRKLITYLDSANGEQKTVSVAGFFKRYSVIGLGVLIDTDSKTPALIARKDLAHIFEPL